MTFHYEYKPYEKGGAKKALIAAAVLILVFSIYSLGTTITGYFTYSGAIESELNKTKADLDVYKAVGEQCTRDLWQKEQNLSRCEGSLGETYVSLQACSQQNAALSGQLALVNSSLSSCLSDISLLQGTYGNLTASYNNLVRNSVKAICCSFGDVQSAVVRNWNITNDRIICSGSFSVNCSSGETSF